MSRHPQISLRTPEALHRARALADKPEDYERMFNALKAVMDEYEFQPSNIWNMDETNKDPHFSKVVAAKGRKNVVSINDSAQEQHVTVVGAISATGDRMPPLIIYMGKKVMTEWGLQASAGTRFAATETGWIDRFAPEPARP